MRAKLVWAGAGCLLLAGAAFLWVKRPASSTSAKPPPELTGSWSGGDWGSVVFDGKDGTYTSTYGPEPGEIALVRVDDLRFTGTWGEPDGRRRGTLELALMEDGQKLVGTWTADGDCEIQGASSGTISWGRIRE